MTKGTKASTETEYSLSELQQSYNKLHDEHETVKAELEDYKAKYEAVANECTKLIADKDGLQDEFNAQEKIIAELTTQVENLSSKASETIAEKGSALSTAKFEVDGKKYGFAFPQAHHQGNVITHTEVLADEGLQRHLVKIKSGFVKELE